MLGKIKIRTAGKKMLWLNKIGCGLLGMAVWLAAGISVPQVDSTAKELL